MQIRKKPGESWSITDVATASGRSYESVRALAGRLLPAELLEPRAGRGAAVQLPESVALALVFSLRFGALNPSMIEAMKSDPAAAKAAVDGLATLARLVAPRPDTEAA